MSRGFKFKKPGRPPKYPWDKWLDGNVHRLRHGVHFTRQPQDFQTAVHGMAATKGWSIETNIEGDVLIIKRGARR